MSEKDFEKNYRWEDKDLLKFTSEQSAKLN